MKKYSIENIDSIVDELRVNRNGVYEMMEKVSKITSDIDDLVPDSKDFRSRYALEQKTKVLTEFLKLNLDFRKQIDSSLKTEYDFIKKAIDMDEDEEFEDAGMIRRLAREITKMEKEEGVKNAAKKENRGS